MIKKILILIISIMSVSMINCYAVHAYPNSSKGYAEYDDVQAEEENKKILEKQEKEKNIAVGKSTNNYLENLQVEGYELIPSFDKQTIDYTLKGKISSDEITILAVPSDEKAKIEGIGKIKLEANQKQCRVDVISETGTVRTYNIYLEEQLKKEYENQSIKNEFVNPEETNSIIEEKSENTNFMDNIIFVILIVIIGAFIIILSVKRNKTKAKH